jgi:mono/diheme cytochrome c family protein
MVSTPMTGPRRIRAAGATLALWAVVALGALGCSSAPEVPVGPDGEPDPELVLGRDIYSGRCSNCHGSEGQGGRGPKLNAGASLSAYPEASAMAAVIANGLNQGMPAFGDSLSSGEIDAVVAYIREVLN